VREIRIIALLFLLFAGLHQAEVCSAQADRPQPMHGDRIDVDIYGNLYILDSEKNTLRLYSKEGDLVREIGGSGWQNDQFDHPSGIWARNGIDVFVADYGNHRIQRFDRALSYVSTFSTRDSDNPDERFGYPTSVTISRLGDLFICDSENTRIVKVNRFTQVERVFGGFGAGSGRLQKPLQIEIGPGDFVYVLDGARVLVYDTFGNFIHELTQGVFKKPLSVYADGEGVAVLDENNLYCFDSKERPSVVSPLESLHAGLQSEIRSIAFGGNTLYLLTASGVVPVHSPRPAARRSDLDK
jgi:DNA-binding beta-propeller fold protein YncE